MKDKRERGRLFDKTRLLGEHVAALDAFGIDGAGRTWCESPYVQRMRPGSPYGRFVIAHICISGVAEVYVDGRWVILPMGSVYGTMPEQPQGYRAAPGGKTQLLWARYQYQPASDRIFPEGVQIRPFRGSIAEATESYDRLYAESIGHQRPRVLRHRVGLLAAFLSDGIFGRDRRRRLAPLWVAVNRDIGRRWDLAGLASAAGLSREALRQICKDETGKSPMQHVTTMRMLRATELFEDDLKLETVASMVGYDNSFAFSRAFKKQMGLAPRIWQKRSHNR
jgi:AraC-like DNA-binding protein